MRDLQHPIITNMERTGYPDGKEPFASTEDYFGREVERGDEILILDDDIFLLDELDEDAEILLRDLGAIQDTAE